MNVTARMVNGRRRHSCAPPPCAYAMPPALCIATRCSVLALAVASVVWGLMLLSSSSLIVDVPSQQQRVVSDAVSVTIVVLAFRGYSARSVVGTLRGAGQWAGPIIVVGDRSSTSPEDCAHYYSRDGASKTSLLLAEPPPTTLREVKFMKTRVFSAVSASGGATALSRAAGANAADSGGRENYVLYLDVDIEVSKPIQLFIDEALEIRRASSSSPSSSCDLLFFPERFWHSLRRGHRFNSGAFLARDSTAGRAVLAEWGDVIRHSEHFKYDQGSLMDVLSPSLHHRTKAAHGGTVASTMAGPAATVCPLPARHITFVPSIANARLLRWPIEWQHWGSSWWGSFSTSAATTTAAAGEHGAVGEKHDVDATSSRTTFTHWTKASERDRGGEEDAAASGLASVRGALRRVVYSAGDIEGAQRPVVRVRKQPWKQQQGSGDGCWVSWRWTEELP